MAVERKDYADLKKQVSSDPVSILRAAGKARMSMSQYCNAVTPDIFLEEKRSVLSRMREEEGLFTRSSEISRASTIDDFITERGELGQVLLYDVLYRAYNRPRLSPTVRSALITGSESYFDSSLYPAVTRMPRPDQIVMPYLDIAELVAIEHDIRGTSYKPFYWDYEEGKLKRLRTNPGTALPKVSLLHKEAALSLYKWGNAFELSYEALRDYETQVDKLSSLMELEGETDKIRMIGELMGILENGDSTPNSAASSKKASAYDSSITEAGKITAEAFLGFVDDFIPYGMTHAIMRAGLRRKLFLTTTGSDQVHLAQLLNISAIGVPALTDMNPNGGVRVGAVRDEDLGANKIIGINSMRAVEKVNSAGSSVSEQATNIQNQTELFTLSDTYNYAKLDFEATKIMTLTV